MLRIHRHILWSLMPLLLCSSLAWCQERAYSTDRSISLVVPEGWATRAYGASSLSLMNPRGRPTVSIHASAGTKNVEATAEMYRKDGWVVKESKPESGAVSAFQLLDMSKRTSVPWTGQLSGFSPATPKSKGGEIAANYFPQKMSQAEMQELMATVRSFRVEDGSGALLQRQNHPVISKSKKTTSSSAPSL